MKLEWRFPSDFPPETVQKYIVNKEALIYLKNSHPEIIDLKILSSHRENKKQFAKLKYHLKGALPNPLHKKAANIPQSFIADLIIDMQTNITTMEILPGLFSNKIHAGGKIYFEEQKDAWIQHVEGDITVNIVGIGKMLERRIEKKFYSTFALENEIRNRFLATQVAHIR